jgi:ribonuclease BN (tRNA processing enzyme)
MEKNMKDPNLIIVGGPPAGGPPSKVHEERFSVITIGTGNPMPNPNRASASTVVQYNGKYYVVDTGDGVSRNFTKYKMAFSDINAVLISHLHLDHTSDYSEIVVNRWMTTGKEMTLIGPPRTGSLHTSLLDIFADDLVYRMYREASSRGISEIGMFKGITIKELTGKNTFELDGIKFSTADLVHTQYNLGYRFEANGKSIVVSGDTDYSTNLVELAKGVDILVLDVSTNMAQKSSDVVFEDPNIKKPEPKYEFSGNFNVNPHMDVEKGAKTAVEANPKKVVLTHFGPAPIELDKIISIFRKAGYDGEIIEAFDGLEINP